MNLPLISFIIPYYNNGNTIQETIDSIFAQSYKNFDVYIINDGSKEVSSIKKLKELEGKKQITVLNQENAGPSIARNLAIKKSKAQYIIPLDADDLITPLALDNVMDVFNKNSEIGIVYGDLSFFGERQGTKIQEEFDIRKQLLWNQIAVCAIIKKEVFLNAGYYDEFLSKPGLEDWEFWLRVYSHNWKFKKINANLFKIRINSSSRTFKVANKNLVEIKAYVYKKHATLLQKSYEELFYKVKMIRETPDFKIGGFLLKPYRKIKNILKG